MNLSLRIGLLGFSGALMLRTLYLVFLQVPSDAITGIIQRSLYFHAPIGIVGLSSIGLVAIASIAYLIKPNHKWDAVAYATAEIGVLFTSLMLITGMLWGKPTWGVWWDWSPKLTTTLILWFIYVGYLMLRAYAPKGVRGARYAAVLGIFGFIDVPIVYQSTVWWRDVHPERVVGAGAADGAMTSAMVMTFGIASITFLVLAAALIVERYHLRVAEEETERILFANEAH